MLDFKKNRLDYGTLLMPPEGYELTHAVATTYSLDLYTLLAIPVALFYSKVLDGSFGENRFDVLESIALQNCSIYLVYFSILNLDGVDLAAPVAGDPDRNSGFRLGGGYDR